MSDLFRVYLELGSDGYPPEWHQTIKHLVREQAGNRCQRCGHPYRNGEHGSGEWSPCDAECEHADTIRVTAPDGFVDIIESYDADTLRAFFGDGYTIEALWRILTVHHLNGDKADCRWWNLAALCQRCHLRIQRKVVMGQVYPWEHTEWFKPHAAGWYAVAYLGEELTREETMARLDELLALERIA